MGTTTPNHRARIATAKATRALHARAAAAAIPPQFTSGSNPALVAPAL